jgi:hypothetical protein
LCDRKSSPRRKNSGLDSSCGLQGALTLRPDWSCLPSHPPASRIEAICPLCARPNSVCVRDGLAGWGGGIRTSASRNQIC